MVRFKKLLASLCAAILAASLSFAVSAEKVNLDSWNTDSTLYDVLDTDTESNSAVEYAFLRVKYDRPSNRIKLLFMLGLDSFTDEKNAGVTLSVNGDEKITLHLDGSSEYNEDKYFAQINSVSDPMSKTLCIEVTLGIKKGIPETVSLEFNVYDTEGVASNTYAVDITETAEEDTTTSSHSEPEKTSKTKATKTTRAKTTKAKTTKSKTTKRNSADNIEPDISDTDKNDITTAFVNIQQTEIETKETGINERKLTAIVAAITIAAVGTASGGVYFFRKSRKQRDGG